MSVKRTHFGIPFSSREKRRLSVQTQWESIHNVENLVLNISYTLPSDHFPDSQFVLVDDGPPINETRELFTEGMANKSTLYFEMYEDVYVTHPCTKIAGNSNKLILEDSPCVCQKKPPNITTLTHIGSYNMAIGICHLFTGVFGHFIEDYFPHFLLIPDSLKKDSIIVSVCKKDQNIKYYNLVGINENQLLYVPANSYIYARRYITIFPKQCGKQNFFAKQYERKFLYKALNISIKKPFRNVVFLRERGPRNADLYGTIKRMFPKANFELYRQQKSLKEIGQFFSETRLLWTVHGSNQANTVFMQEGSTLVDLHTKKLVDFYFRAVIGLGINFIMIRDEKLVRYVRPDYPIPLSRIRTSIEVAFNIMNRKDLI